MVGISVTAWNAAAAPMRRAPPPRKSICRVRKFWVAASEAPSRKQQTRKPAKVRGTLGSRTPGSVGETGSPANGFTARQIHVPSATASGA